MIKLYYTPNQAKTSPLSLSLGTFAFLNPHGPKETPAGTELPRLRAALRWFIWVYMCIKHFMCALKTVWFCLQWILGLSLLALVSSMLMEQCANGGGNIGIPSRNNSWYTCTSCKRRILGEWGDVFVVYPWSCRWNAPWAPSCSCCQWWPWAGCRQVGLPEIEPYWTILNWLWIDLNRSEHMGEVGGLMSCGISCIDAGHL